MKNCNKCNTLHEKPGKFCSRSCANIRGPRIPRVTSTCPNCEIQFEHRVTETRKFCSSKCHLVNSGGYREGSGRAKTGYYKGIYCGSTYELCWVIYNLDHGFEFSRFPGKLEVNGVIYYPDFLTTEMNIVEIKGYEHQDSVDRKTKVAESHGYTVNVLRHHDMNEMFEYVTKIYGKKLHILYDDYKPKYSYICHYCDSEFTRDSLVKTEAVFCSRVCCGKGHRGRVEK